MAMTGYQYETSPRKLEPEIKRKKHNKRRKLRVVEDLPRQDVQLSAEQKRRQVRLTLIVAGIFLLLLTISYRNSQINEKFNDVQNLKKELSSLQKENEQLRVSIENGVNVNTIEKLAKEKLGMEKLTSKQTIYINLPKQEYTESESEKVVIEDDKNWFEKLIDSIFNKD